jgi:hypothetical protein
MTDRKEKKKNEGRIKENIQAQIDKDISNIFSPKNISKAGKLHRELSSLSANELLRPFTV